MSETTGIELRPEVRAFAEAMQRLLDEHQDEKGDGWKGDDPYLLLLSVYGKATALREAVRIGPKSHTTRYKADILRAAASVGAHAMFVADVCGALPTERGER